MASGGRSRHFALATKSGGWRRLMGYARLMVGFLLKNSRAAPILHAHIRIVAAPPPNTIVGPQETPAPSTRNPSPETQATDIYVGSVGAKQPRREPRADACPSGGGAGCEHPGGRSRHLRLPRRSGGWRRLVGYTLEWLGSWNSTRCRAILHAHIRIVAAHCPLAHLEHFVGQGVDVGGVMRDQQHRHVQLPLQRVELQPHLAPQLRVQRRERLVQQQDIGLQRERPRQRHACFTNAGSLG